MRPAVGSILLGLALLALAVVTLIVQWGGHALDWEDQLPYALMAAGGALAASGLLLRLTRRQRRRR